MYYSAADVLVVPSHYESFGLAAVEALACGTPVVATPVGATSEILTPLDGGLMAESVNARSLASAIERALAHTGITLRIDCHEYARDHLAWDIIIGRWESALEELQAATALA